MPICERVADGGRHGVRFLAQQLQIADQRGADHLAGDRALRAHLAQPGNRGAEFRSQQFGHPAAGLDHGIEVVARQAAQRHGLGERILDRGRALGLCTVRRTDPYRLVGGRIERRFRRKPVARRLGHGAMMSPAESFDQDAIWASHAGIVWLYGRFLRSGPP